MSLNTPFIFPTEYIVSEACDVNLYGYPNDKIDISTNLPVCNNNLSGDYAWPCYRCNDIFSLNGIQPNYFASIPKELFLPLYTISNYGNQGWINNPELSKIKPGTYDITPYARPIPNELLNDQYSHFFYFIYNMTTIGQIMFTVHDFLEVAGEQYFCQNDYGPMFYPTYIYYQDVPLSPLSTRMYCQLLPTEGDYKNDQMNGLTIGDKVFGCDSYRFELNYTFPDNFFSIKYTIILNPYVQKNLTTISYFSIDIITLSGVVNMLEINPIQINTNKYLLNWLFVPQFNNYDNFILFIGQIINYINENITTETEIDIQNIDKSITKLTMNKENHSINFNRNGNNLAIIILNGTTFATIDAYYNSSHIMSETINNSLQLIKSGDDVIMTFAGKSSIGTKCQLENFPCNNQKTSFTLTDDTPITITKNSYSSIIFISIITLLVILLLLFLINIIYKK